MSTMETSKNLWVLIETEEGQAKPVGYELLNPGKQLAEELGEKLVAVVMGHQVEEVAKKQSLTAQKKSFWWKAKNTISTTRMLQPLRCAPW